MPVITFESGAITDEKKRILIESLTNCAVMAGGWRKEQITVLINEYPPESIGVGGKQLSEIIRGN